MTAPADEVVRVEHLNKQYETAAGPQPVLKDIDLVIHRGEFVALMGPSGSGKSTFMNILGCLDTPTSGRYVIDGNDTAQLDSDNLAGLRNRFIGFVFQGFNLLPRASLMDNVALPLIYASVGRREREARAVEMLAKVGLERYTDYRPNQISGGQQQRVAIARALATRPRMILADEPTGNLDSVNSHDIMSLFRALNTDDGITIILVTHEPDVARFANRLVNFIDGCISHDGPVEDHLGAAPEYAPARTAAGSAVAC